MPNHWQDQIFAFYSPQPPDTGLLTGIKNAHPGADRAQWFPYVAVDSTTGRVWVFYYDQGVATSGGLSVAWQPALQEKTSRGNE